MFTDTYDQVDNYHIHDLGIELLQDEPDHGLECDQYEA